MSTNGSSGTELTLENLCLAALREKDKEKQSLLIEEIDRRLDEDHKRSSLKRALREQAA